MKHTLGPLEHTFKGDENLIGTPGVRFVATTLRYDYSVATAEDYGNAQHLVACWNACEGINPEAVPDLLATLELMAGDIDGYLSDEWDGNREGGGALSRRAHSTSQRVKDMNEG